MILLTRLFVFGTPLALFGLVEVFYFYPEQWRSVALAMVVLVCVTIIMMMRKSLSVLHLIQFLLTPLILVVGLIGFLMFIEQVYAFDARSIFLFHVSSALIAGFVGIYLNNVFLFHFDASRYQPQSIANTTSVLNVLGLFLFSSALFGLSVFFSQPAWALFLVWMLVVTLLTLSVMVAHNISFDQSRSSVIVSGVLLGEFFWVLLLSPLGMYASALLVTTVYYMFVNLSRYFYLRSLDSARIRRYLIVGGTVFVLTLLTAPWL